MQTEKKERTPASVVRRWVFFIIALLAAMFLIMHLTGRRIVMNDQSMYPTLTEGDLLVVDRITYLISGPKRFDIVIYPSRYEPDALYIRRIIGLPGETVQIVEGEIYINGKVLQKQPEGLAQPLQAGRSSEMITLGMNEYFVLCDDRSNLNDSREPFIGGIRRDEIQGRVRFRAWPLGRIGVIG